MSSELENATINWLTDFDTGKNPPKTIKKTNKTFLIIYNIHIWSIGYTFVEKLFYVNTISCECSKTISSFSFNSVTYI